MGRKKKPFIDKKKATKFHLVPRSQADPLLDDPTEPQHVLKPEQPAAPSTEEERLTQQRYYGVHYTDDYDYLQHLKEPGTAVLEPSLSAPPPPPALPPFPSASVSSGLPGSVFGSEVKVEGHLGKILPISGPQPDWDPDIVASLDNPDLNFDLDDQLEDDFVIQANGGEADVPVYVTDSRLRDEEWEEEEEEGGGGGGGGAWWMGRGDFTAPTSLSHHLVMEQEETDQSDDGSGKAVGGALGSEVMPDWSHSEERVATFTDYSISSSIVPRNKGLTQLDERFEKFMTGYEDSELGAPEVEEIEGEEGDKWLLDFAVRDFERNFSERLHLVSEGKTASRECEDEEGEGGEAEEERHSGEDEEKEKDASDRVEEEVVVENEEEEEEEEEEGREGREEREVVMVEVGRPEWDCESILSSTYSNLYNHPTKIVEPVSSTTKQPRLPSSIIPLSNKTGIPLGSIPGPLAIEKPAKQMPVTRPRHETSEERRERKKAVKEERKFRRSEKKATKVMFHSEQLRQERVNFTQQRTATII